MSALVAIALTAVLLAATSPAPAQLPPLDHLECFKIKDPLKLRTTIDLDSPELATPGCTVSKAQLFCMPVRKTVRESNVPILPVDGQNLTQNRVCYKVRCPHSAPFAPDVTDQFGNRVLERRRAFLLCTPAREGPQTTTTTASVVTTTITTTTMLGNLVMCSCNDGATPQACDPFSCPAETCAIQCANHQGGTLNGCLIHACVP